MGARSPRVVTSAYDIEIGGDIRIWHIASFWCAVNFGRYRGIADSGRPSTAVTGRHGGGFLWAGARWVTLHGAAFLGGGPLGPSAGLGALRPLDHLYWLTSRHGSALIGTAADAPHVRSCSPSGSKRRPALVFWSSGTDLVQSRHMDGRNSHMYIMI